MRSSLRLLLAVALLVYAGCVSLDRRAWDEQVNKTATAEFSETYLNRAVYRSKGEFVASQSLAEALGLPASTADRVLVSFSGRSHLTLQFTKGDKILLSKAFALSDGLQVTAHGSVNIPLPAICGGHDSPGFGCGSKSVTLYLNSARELVCVESGAAVGVVGLFPVAIYAKLVSIYMRPTGNRDADNVPTVQ